MKKWLIRLPLILLGLLAALALIAVIGWRLINRASGSLVSSGEKRAYLLYVPETYHPGVPTPLVITIHGFAQWPAHQMQVSQWNELADEYGFIVVYPMGTGFPLRWRTNGEPGSEIDPMLDVTFISDLIDKLSAEYTIDPARIYANGLSNGGGMSFVLACELSERIAAIGTVAGAYLFPWDACKPSRPVPVIAFHGTADPIVPYQGGPSERFDIPFPFIPDWVAEYARLNGCNRAPFELPAQGETSVVQYTACLSDADVIFYTITGGGHSWPGGDPIPEFIVGKNTQDVDATELMWEFFQQHPLPKK